MTTSTDRDFRRLNGHDVLGAHADTRGMTLITRPRHFWPGLFGAPRPPADTRQARPGSRLISAGAVLLFLLGTGLLAVSFAAQYQYVLHERHQHVASLIEAFALDVGLIIFSLLALGLARAGLSAKVERAAVIGCAIGSAVMNYAAADVTSPRSVLAYCMPPVFLAFVVDRVVRTIQRHVLGMNEARSPWSVLAVAAARGLRVLGLAALYGLRFLVAAPSTCSGVRRAILAAAPLPAAAELTAPETSPEPTAEASPVGQHRERRQAPRSAGRGDTKTSRFLAAVRAKYGEFSTIAEDRVSPICTELAPTIGLDCGAARTALRSRVLAALPDGEGDVR